MGRQVEGAGEKQVFKGVGKKSSCLHLLSLLHRATMSHAAQNNGAKLQGAVAGNWFAWPDVCTAVNGWSIPTEKFRVEEIVGQYLVKLKDCPGRDCNRLKMQRFCNHCQRPEPCLCDRQLGVL